jgi:hypothetical protein
MFSSAPLPLSLFHRFRGWFWYWPFEFRGICWCMRRIWWDPSERSFPLSRALKPNRAFCQNPKEFWE